MPTSRLYAQRLAQAIRATPPSGVEVGVVMALPDSTHAQVDLSGRAWTVTIPATVTGIQVGHTVTVATTGNTRVLTSIRTAIDVPATGTADDTAIPSAPTRPAHFLDAGYSVTGFTVQDEQNAAYANYLCDRLTDADVAIDSLRHAVDDAMTIINRLQDALSVRGIIT